MQLVVSTLGSERHALPIDRVQEIIRIQPRTARVISLRGRLVPVRDIAARVGAGALTAAEPKIVVVELPGGPAGILVDADRVPEGIVPEPEPEPEPEAERAPAPKPRRRQPSRKRSEKATRSSGGAKTGSPSKVTA